ncbi:hypothetical protein [Agaribacter marinus]|uniref:hypothetical protein n=1 Tax=Agaribacter marinus TaxID=1431249 RepID=UPI0024E17FC6|nr:hypothetical protein [Agaribacter marinus]
MQIRFGFFFALILLIQTCNSVALANEIGLSGRIEAAVVDRIDLVTWQQSGTGILRAEDDGLALNQAFLIYQSRSWKGLSFEAVANGYMDGEQNIGFTQALIKYKPLSANKVKMKGRFGFFYPEFSVENTASGWLSPYLFTQSAINSWYGEELRTMGAELSLYSPGRTRRSPWTWELIGAAYKGNDPLGSILTWRGFALHDRQSLHSDRVLIAPTPGVVDEGAINGPAWIEPFTEIDSRFGFYVGGHARYIRKTDFRFYYYDNQANPNELNHQRLYAWRTKFHSLAIQHNINREWRVFSQLLDGSTDMGARIVSANFTSAYIGLSWRPAQNRKHRVSARYDWFEVNETDNERKDPNNSNGDAFTIAWRYSYSKVVSVGIEHHVNNSDVENRVFFDQEVKQSQQQTMAVVSFNF